MASLFAPGGTHALAGEFAGRDDFEVVAFLVVLARGLSVTAFDPYAALALPPETKVDRRVPKTLLIENGASAAGDRRRIGEGIRAT